MFHLDREAKVYRSSLLEEQKWLQHGFGTRQAEQWPGITATLKQTHSDHVHLIEHPCHGEQGEGDALVAQLPGSAISIRTADCVPILLADPVQKAVAAVHAGWKGTALAIVQRAVEQMHLRFGTRPVDVVAAIGPAIGECCYEVSEDVASRFTRYRVASGEEKLHLNLAAINRTQLEDTGVLQIDVLDVCTRCEAEWCHSYRRDGDLSGRMHASIGIELIAPKR